MAERIPVRISETSDPTGLAELAADDFIGIKDGGTGAVTAEDARVALDVIGNDQRDVANGVAALDALGKLSDSVIPALAIVDHLGEVADQTEMLALVGEEGDWCTRTDLQTNWIVIAQPSSLLTNWEETDYPMKKLSDDLVPQLGAPLDTNGFTIDFKPQATPTHKEGRMHYNEDTHTYDFMIDIPDVTLNGGEELWRRVINKTGSVIPNGSVVYQSGVDGATGRAEVSLALASHNTPRVMGVATHDIGIDAQGVVTTFGRVGDIDTTLLSLNDVLYLSTTNPGEFTKTQPDTPNDIIVIGHVVEISVTGGITIDLSVIDFAEIESAFIGSIVETIVVSTDSDGVTITASIAESLGADHIHVLFSDGLTTFSVDPVATIALTPGAINAPIRNYVYIDGGTKLLTANTTGYPVTEHAPLADILVLDAVSTQNDEPLKTHVWTDHLATDGDNGHIGHINSWIRQQHATWLSGVALTPTIVPQGASPDDVTLGASAGLVLQLHQHVYGAQADPAPFWMVNDPLGSYNRSANLNEFTTDSLGGSFAGKYFNIVVWGSVNEESGDCKLFCNLPSGSNNGPDDAILDVDKFSNYNIPSDFRGTGFLIARLTLRLQVAAGGTYTLVNQEDLRGLFPTQTAGSGSATSEVFDDVGFGWFNAVDPTKTVKVDLTNVPTATEVIVTMPSADLDLESVGGFASLTQDASLAYDITAADLKGGLIEMSNGAANAVTIVNNATVPFPVLGRLRIAQMGAGVTSIVAGGGVNIVGNLNVNGQYNFIDLYQQSADNWVAQMGV